MQFNKRLNLLRLQKAISLLVMWGYIAWHQGEICAQVSFQDLSEQAGINEALSHHGVSLVDVDGDGWEDIYISCRQHPNQLFHHNGDGTYKEIAEEVGLDYRGDCRLGIWGDINNDGRPDLFLGTQEDGDFLYVQLSDGSFQDISLTAGMHKAAGPTLGAIFGDIDNDGWIDLYCARHYRENTLYRNNGNETFSDITFRSGAVDQTAAMGVIGFDYDRDQDLDLYLVHDAKFDNKLYQNDGTGIFTNVAEEAGVNYAGFGMGVDVADVNHDGWFDIYITNFFENTLFLNNGDGTFSDISEQAGVDDTGMGWGVTFFDADNDGWVDIYLANSLVANNLYPAFPNAFFLNNRDGTFELAGTHTPLASMGNALGLASGDLDRDGRVDLMVANFQDEMGSHLFRNETQTSHHWIKLHLQGTASNRSAIGALVSLKAGGMWQHDAVIAGNGWASQNSLDLHFGLGLASEIDTLKILWPSGNLDIYHQVPADQHLHIVESGATDEHTLWLYPNPIRTEESLTIKTPFAEADIQLFALSGQKISLGAYHYNPYQQAFQVNMKHVSPGIYVLKAGNLSQKIVIY